MATKIIKALVDGVVQNIEVEATTSPEQMLSPEERLDTLEDKHEVVFTDGNILVGDGTTELKEMTPEETLSHINGVSIKTMTTEEYKNMEDSESNANTLYMLTDAEEEIVQPDLSQNDPTQPDYVKNRTHYEEVNATNVLEFDGDYTGKEVIEVTFNDGVGDTTAKFVKVSDFCDISVSDLIDSTIMLNTEEMTISEEVLTDYDIAIMVNWLGVPLIGITKEDNLMSPMGAVIPSKGIWFMYDIELGAGVTKLTTVKPVFVTEKIKKLPNKFLGIVDHSEVEALTWDGDITDKFKFGNYYKVSDLTPSYEEICKGGEMVFIKNGNEYKTAFTSENVSFKYIDDNGMFGKTDISVEIEGYNRTVSVFYKTLETLFEKGTYFSKPNDTEYVSSLKLNARPWEESTVIKPEYLPDYLPKIEVSNIPEKIIFEESTVTLDSDGLIYTEASGLLENGALYTVIWNGSEYKCVAQEVTAEGGIGVIIGNLSLIGLGTDTGEPFMLTTAQQDDVIYLVGATSDTSTEFTFSVKSGGYSETIKPLDAKLLPEHNHAWNDLTDKPFYEEEAKVVLEEMTMTFDPEMDNGWQSTSEIPLEVGKKYKIMWNGTEYECEAYVMSAPNGLTGVGVGNQVALGGADTGEPFVIGKVADEFVEMAGGMRSLVIAIDGTTEAIVSIVESEGSIKKLDNKFLDLDWIPKKVENKHYLVEETVCECTEGDGSGHYIGRFAETEFDISGLNFVTLEETETQITRLCLDQVYVNMNGVEYLCPVRYYFLKGDGTLFDIGNLSHTGGSTSDYGNDIPFSFVGGGREGSEEPSEHIDIFILGSSVSGTNTFSIYTKEESDNLLPNKFLPEHLRFGKTEGYGDTLTWDGNTEGLTTVEIDGTYWYKVSDATPNVDYFRDGTYCSSLGDVGTLKSKYVDDAIAEGTVSDEWSAIIDGLLVVYKPNTSVMDNNIEESGVYILKDSMYLSLLTLTGYEGFKTTVIKPISVEYLPEHLPRYEKGEVILAETTIAFSDGQYMSTLSLPLEDGKSYKVVWNGVEYTCKANTFTMPNGLSGIGVGNAVAIGGTDTGEPFIIGKVLDEFVEMVGGYTCISLSLDGSTDATVSITEKDIITPLDAKFLPDYLPAEFEPITVEIYPETTFTTSDNMYFENILVDLKVGETYTVTWDGVDYECVARNSTFNGYEIVGLGNESIYSGGENTGEPFGFGVMVSIPQSGFVTTDENEHTAKITQTAPQIRKLDNKFLDLEWVPSKTYHDIELIPEQTISFSSNQNTIGVSFESLNVGNTCVVYWNGTEYQCIVHNVSYGFFNMALGNLSLVNSEFPNTGEPFLFIWLSISRVYCQKFVTLDKNTSDPESITVKVVATIPIYNKIPTDYLPEKYIIPTNLDDSTNGNPNNEWMAAQAALNEGRSVYANKGRATGQVLSIDADIFDSYYSKLLYWDSTGLWHYSSSLSGDVAKVIPHRVGLVEGGTFAVPVINSMKAGQVVVPKADVNVYGYCTEWEAIDLPFEFDDSGEISSFIIKSSTEGSTKRFKITVDDSGALNATEIA